MPHEATSTKLTIIKGATKTYLLVVTDEDGAVDLTAHTLFLTIKRTVDDANATIEKVSTDVAEIQIITPQATVTNTGKANVFLLPADTNTLDPDKDYVLDAWIQLSTGEKHQIVVPRVVEVEQPVTLVP